VSSTATAWNGTTSPKTLSGIAVQTGDVIVARGMAEAGDVTINIATTAGSTGAWQLLADQPGTLDANRAHLRTWWTTASATGTINIAFSSSGSTQQFGGVAKVWRGGTGVGAATSTNNGTGSGAPSLAITTTQANSGVDYAIADWNATAGTATFTATGATPVQDVNTTVAGAYRVYSAHVTNIGAAGAKTVGMSAPSTQRYVISAVEVFGPSGTAFLKELNIVAGSALSLLNAVAKRLSFSAPTDTTNRSAISATKAITAPMTTTAPKAIGKPFSVAPIATMASLRNTISKAFATSAATTASLRSSVGKLISTGLTTGMTTAKAMTRPIAITCATAASDALAIGKTISTSAASSLSAVKQSSKAFAISLATSSAVSAIKVKLQTVAIICASTVTNAMASRRTLAIGATMAASSALRVGKTLAAACASTLSAAKAVSKALAITGTASVTATANRAFLLAVSIAAATAVQTKRTVGKVVAASTATAASIARQVGKRLTVLSPTNVTASIRGAVGIVISIAVASSVTTKRNVARAVAIPANAAVSARRAISASIEIFVNLDVTRVISTFANTLGRYARFIVGKATALFIIGRADDAVVVIKPPAQITGTPMATVHDPEEFVCGDNWQLTGPLLDAAGTALNLTGATITWKLDSLDGLTNVLTLDNASNGGVSIVDPVSATILVNVAPARSTDVAPGTYKDWMRVRLADGTELTEWTGVIRAARKPA
jgi:hypothetical protein